MQNAYRIMFESLVGLLKRLYPGFDIFGSEIQRTGDGDDMAGSEDYFFIDLIPGECRTHGLLQTERRVTIDIAGHVKDEARAAYLAMTDRLDMALRPVFRFGGRAITVPEISYRVVDGVLHGTFSVTFMTGSEPVSSFPVMEELESNLERKG